MITLYGFGPYFGMPDGSPHVLKAHVLLRMAARDYVTDTSLTLDKAPKGKLPVIDDAGEIVADTAFIRRHIERKYGFDFDRGLDKTERAEAWAVERMLEDHLYWVCLYMRWAIPENFAAGPAHFFDAVPEPMRETVREGARARVVGYLQGQGMGRHGVDEIADLGMQSLEALSALLGNRAWLMGEQPCGTDAGMTGMLGMLFSTLDFDLRRRALGLGNLAAYADRAMARFFPEHAWAPVAPKAESPALAFA
ncbi:MAG TPA: glutathione S-transferase family protein [Dongiaceae bacterium]|jgi:glutathione S-transferase|nr:glutathione S-transferase family protein [Dongiaceae bacterium]